MKVYIRKAGPWNAKHFKPSSNLGHMMIRVGNNFYGFTQQRLVENPEFGCVEIIPVADFVRMCARQPWFIIEIPGEDGADEQLVNYFKHVVSQRPYSLKQNCVYQCQKALEEVVGLKFDKDYIWPGNMLRFLQREPLQPQIKQIMKHVISAENAG